MKILLIHSFNVKDNKPEFNAVSYYRMNKPHEVLARLNPDFEIVHSLPNDIYPDVSNDWKHRFRTTLFKKGCSISANSTIICGNVIGENTLIGAGSVVSKSMPPNSICFGNPCKFRSVKKI